MFQSLLAVLTVDQHRFLGEVGLLFCVALFSLLAVQLLRRRNKPVFERARWMPLNEAAPVAPPPNKRALDEEAAETSRRVDR